MLTVDLGTDEEWRVTGQALLGEVSVLEAWVGYYYG